MPRIDRTNVTTAVIVQQVGGDLRVIGRAASDLTVDGDGASVEQIGEGQPYLVHCSGDCRITVPQTVPLVVQQVGGDAKITDLDSTLEIGAVGGDLTVRNVGHLQIKTVGGDLRVKWAKNDVIVHRVGSDATIREVMGDVSVERIGSDLYLRNVAGGCIVERTGSDLVLSMDFAPEKDYHFNAGGDILCRIQPGASARFIVPADMAVELDVPADIADSEDGEHQIITVGEGQAMIHLEAGGDLRLVSEGEDYVIDLGIQIEEEIEARMSNLEERLTQQLSGLDERIQARAEQWATQAERFSDRAQQQAERAMERFRRSMDRQKGKRKRSSGTRGFNFTVSTSTGSAAHHPKPEPVSEEERLLVLQMLQEGKISLEEAEQLLAALDAQE